MINGGADLLVNDSTLRFFGNFITACMWKLLSGGVELQGEIRDAEQESGLSRSGKVGANMFNGLKSAI